MEIKHIRWIAVVGLIAIVELQYVWLVNTYKLTKESIQMKGEELFPKQLYRRFSCACLRQRKTPRLQ